MDNEGNLNDVKKINISLSNKTNNNNNRIIYQKEKEKKKRVETNKWGLNETDLSYSSQYEILMKIYNNITNLENSTDIKNYNLVINHIKTKIYGYKHQDIIKKIFNESEFINFEEVVSLLKNSEMKCCYCSCEVYLLYEFVREFKQWSLDRIDNYRGHNKNNLVVACLECNLKRRRTNKEAFMFTKNLTITCEGK